MKCLKGTHIYSIVIALCSTTVLCASSLSITNKAKWIDLKGLNQGKILVKRSNNNAKAATADKLNDEQQFRQFLKVFKMAVKTKNKARLISMFNFPLQTLPQWTNDELRHTAVKPAEGLITQKEFPACFDDIFTKAAIKLIPASGEDDLSEIDKTSTENYYKTLLKITDKGSTLYELQKQYAEDNGNETSFGFVFGKVAGNYKAISYYRPWPLK